MGRGMGAGMGCAQRRSGFGRAFAGETNVADEKEWLSNQQKLLQNRLDGINKQLEKLSEEA